MSAVPDFERAAPGAGNRRAAASALEITLAYHERSKHHPARFAPALGYLDWATQPDPFRRFRGAPLVPLELAAMDSGPLFEPAFLLGSVPAAPLDRTSVSRLFQDALALSAWKQAGSARWPLRVNPSSGNLHPTEGYLITGPVEGVHARPAVHHYAPLEHALELRVELSEGAWRELSARLPGGALLLGLTSIHWREAWKYGERAFRYCHHDVGHAIGCIAVAAAGLGWEARLLEGVVDADLALLLGVHAQTGVEAEHADCVLAVFPQGAGFTLEEQRDWATTPRLCDQLRSARWFGAPNELSSDHHEWPAIDDVSEATRKLVPPVDAFWFRGDVERPSLEIGDSPLPLRRIIHQRRSAVALDGHSGITRAAFCQILRKAWPGPRQVPFSTLPWRPSIDLLLFVHRVAGLAPGLYVLLREPSRREALAGALDPSFAWMRAEGCPESLPLFLLAEGDVRRVAQHSSCDQQIAADGVFAAAMLAECHTSLEAIGPWFYRRLHWEAGAIGQALYLEAEASGIRATGIGCFFDEVSHRAFGLVSRRFQVIYHFTMGGAVEDSRLRTHPPYLHLARSHAR